MGRDLGFKCSKCGKNYSAHQGIGMLYPKEYEEVVGKIRKGNYGSSMKDLMDSDPYVTVDASYKIYCCSSCGHWSSLRSLSLYLVPGVEKEISRAVMATDGEDCTLVREYIHKCRKCGDIMHIASDGELMNLTCPYCGGESEDGPVMEMLWD